MLRAGTWSGFVLPKWAILNTYCEVLMAKRNALAAAIALAAAATLGYVGSEYFPIASSHAVGAPAATAPGPAPRGLPDFTNLVVSQGPAVVHIGVTQRAVASERQSPFSPGDPMYDFFRRFQIPIPEAQPTPRQGLGSGFIITPDGYILTNAHVVLEAAEVTVTLIDKREFKAKVIGADSRTDVAVVKIDAKNLPVVKIGDPSRLKAGEWVAAIGSPFGFDNSVTAGIVSATSRALPASENYVPFIQTDVAINPGNSGGPLFNMNGEVVGINSQIYSRTGGYMGLSFSIPIDAAIKVKNDLVEHGKVRRGRLGVTVQAVDGALADSFGLERAAGALVAGVEPGSPAAAAGLQPGDIILSAGGKPIENSTDLPRIVSETTPGTALTVRVWRKGAGRDLRVTVGEWAAERVAAAPAAGEASPGRLGVVVHRLSPEERKSYGVEAGVVVEQANGPAAQAGIRPGDVILAFGNERVDSPEQLKRLVDKAKGNIAVLVKREEARIYIPVRIG
jgi:serine protease Do